VANLNLNKVILGGRIASEVELKTTPSGVAVTTFSLAVNRKYSGKGEEQQTDFINVTAWRGTAEFITKFFRKGSSLCIVGSLQVRSWTDKDGNKRYATDVVADEAMFVDAKSEGGAVASAPAPTSYMPEAYATAPQLEPMGEDEELPF
jgi:single-strand DNA-binding protein